MCCQRLFLIQPDVLPLKVNSYIWSVFWASSHFCQKCFPHLGAAVLFTVLLVWADKAKHIITARYCITEMLQTAPWCSVTGKNNNMFWMKEFHTPAACLSDPETWFPAVFLLLSAAWTKIIALEFRKLEWMCPMRKKPHYFCSLDFENWNLEWRYESNILLWHYYLQYKLITSSCVLIFICIIHFPPVTLIFKPLQQHHHHQDYMT